MFPDKVSRVCFCFSETMLNYFLIEKSHEKLLNDCKRLRLRLRLTCFTTHFREGYFDIYLHKTLNKVLYCKTSSRYKELN